LRGSVGSVFSGCNFMYSGQAAGKGAASTCLNFRSICGQITGSSLVDRGDWSARLSYAHNVPRFHHFPVRSLHIWFWTAPLVAQDSFAFSGYAWYRMRQPCLRIHFSTRSRTHSALPGPRSPASAVTTFSLVAELVRRLAPSPAFFISSLNNAFI